MQHTKLHLNYNIEWRSLFLRRKNNPMFSFQSKEGEYAAWLRAFPKKNIELLKKYIVSKKFSCRWTLQSSKKVKECIKTLKPFGKQAWYQTLLQTHLWLVMCGGLRAFLSFASSKKPVLQIDPYLYQKFKNSKPNDTHTKE